METFDNICLMYLCVRDVCMTIYDHENGALSRAKCREGRSLQSEWDKRGREGVACVGLVVGGIKREAKKKSGRMEKKKKEYGLPESTSATRGVNQI